MTYYATSKRNWVSTKSFDNLKDAIVWCNKQKTKYGHRVHHIEVTFNVDGTKKARSITDYETFGNK